VHEGDVVDVVARLTSRSFGGYESLQLDIRDVATAGVERAPAFGAATTAPGNGQPPLVAALEVAG
jgi:hypothetical protein